MNYFIIYDWMIKDLGLRGAELLVFAYYYSWVESGRECNVKISDVAEGLGMSRQTYNEAVKNLYKKLKIVRKVDIENVKKVYKICQESLQKMSRNLTLNVKKLDTQLYITIYTINITGSNARTHAREEKEKKQAQQNSEKRSQQAPELDKESEIIFTGISDFMTANGGMYVPDFRTQTTAALELAAKLRSTMKAKGWLYSPDSFRTFYNDFLANAYRVADQWQREHFEINNINKQFNNLINKILNGDQPTNISRRSGGISRGCIADLVRKANGVV